MKERDSNIELLRIVAMILVMVVHASFLAIGVPQTRDAISLPIPTYTRFFIEAVSVVCVNVFILISGWYGINIKMHKLHGLIFQVLFFSCLIYGAFLIYDSKTYSNFDSFGTVFLIHSTDYWFIKSYLLLLLLSPVLNTFISNSSERQLCYFLLLFYLFQTIYGWLSIYGAQEFEGGYSALSFIGLYMLARYLHLYPVKRLDNTTSVNFVLFFIIALFLAIVAFVVTYLGYPISGRLFTYTNPLVILESLFLLFAFCKIKLRSKAINWIASSCLAVYLLHANELFLRTYYGKIIKYWFLNENTFYFWIYTIGFMSILFISAILIDKVRIWLWKIISKTLVFSK
jgi:hypothetical protein